MALPAGQQPSRPVDPEDEENARNHCPPHNVRLKALLLNTGRKYFWKKLAIKSINKNILQQKKTKQSPQTKERSFN